MPSGLSQALGPVLEQIAAMTIKIKLYDRQIQQLGQTDYPETQALRKVPGVGDFTALTFVLTLGSKERFKQSRDVGCYLGLRPRRSQSGDRDPQLGITKAGNVYLRSLLIECAGHILRPQGKDSSLRQGGLHLAARGGKQARNKAVVGVARKLAVLLHRIWITQGPYVRTAQTTGASISEGAKEIAWKAQNRLHKRYMRQAAAGNDKRKITTAIARKLLGFIWAIGIRAETVARHRIAPDGKAKATHR